MLFPDIGTPEGAGWMRGVHPDVPIWLAAIDQGPTTTRTWRNRRTL
jgi:hypothetical protein